MSRDYRLPEFHPYAMLPPLDLQPPLLPPFHYYPFQHSHQLGNPTATTTYEMTPAPGSGVAGADATSAPPLHPDSSTSHFVAGEGDYEMLDLQCVSASAAGSDTTSRSKRRKSCATSSALSDYSNSSHGTSQATTCNTLTERKHNHSEIEKRRRNRMNMYISELSSMIPMCGAMSRKLDKLSVLRMAVQHVRSVCGSQLAGPLPGRARPAAVCERDLNTLLLRAVSDAALFVVGCARGRLHYVSQSVLNMLHYDQSELLGQSLFDILHPKDVAKVKEQLSSFEVNPRGRLIDAKTMLPVKSDVVAGAERLCSGARRSFVCRIKCQQPPAPALHLPPSDTNTSKSKDKKYCVVQCTGYLKLWTGEATRTEHVPESEDEQSGNSCLVALAVAVPSTNTTPAAPPAPAAPSHPPTRLLQYVSRHAIDGKFLFVDQRVRLAVGFLPQELVGTSLYEHVATPQLGAVARAHKLALTRKQALRTQPYCFIRKDGTRATIQTHFKPFRNPWTNEMDCLVANNTIVSEWEYTEASTDASPPYEAFAQNDVDPEVQRLIEAQVESHRIGAAIAEETYRCPQIANPQDHIFNACFTEQILGAGDPGPLAPAPPSPASPPLGLDGNGEADMAVIMNMLEADAGLGGPLQFTGVPWPLP